MKKVLLGTSNYAQEIKSHVDLYVTRGKHNEASSRRKLDPIEKNVWGTGNLLAFFFKGVSNFDAQNPVIGSLLREINLEKKKITSDLISKAPQINDVISRRRFENLRKTGTPWLATIAHQPTAPPLSPEPTAPLLSPTENLPPPPPYSLFARKDVFTGTDATPGEQVMSEIERVIEKEKTETEEVIPDNPLLQYFEGINEVLDMSYQLQKEKEELELETF